MANLILPRRFTQQPQHPSGIAGSYANRVKFAINPAPHFASLKDEAGVQWSLLGSSDWRLRAIVPYQDQIQFYAKTQYGGEDSGLLLPSGGSRISNTAGAIVFRIKAISVSNYETPFEATNCVLYRGGASTNIYTNIGGSTVEHPVSYENQIANGKVTIFTWGPFGRKLFNDGRLIISSGTAPGASAVSGDLKVLKNDANSYLGFLAYIDRIMSDGEAASLSANPWQIFRRTPQVLYFDAATGGATDLTADTQSYTLTGQSAGLTAARKLSADAQSYTLTGSAATFTRGYVMAAEVGAYSLTGNSANVTAARTLSASAGTFSYTGIAADLTYTPVGAFSLTADPGSFTLSGVASGLLAARKLTAAAQSYTLTGIAANLTYTPTGSYSLTADVGSFALTGQASGLLVSRKMAAALGTFALTGNAVDILRGWGLTADAASFAVSGVDAAFPINRRLTAEHGAFALTGNAATMTYSGAPPVEETKTGGGDGIWRAPYITPKTVKKSVKKKVEAKPPKPVRESLIEALTKSLTEAPAAKPTPASINPTVAPAAATVNPVTAPVLDKNDAILQLLRELVASQSASQVELESLRGQVEMLTATIEQLQVQLQYNAEDVEALTLINASLGVM